MRGSLVLPVLCAVILAAPAVGQRVTALQAGSRVRVRAAGLGARPVIATVVAVDADTLVLKPDSEAAGLLVPWDSTATVEIGSWRTHELEGALAGLVAGLLVAAAASPCDYDECTLGELLLEGTYRVMPDPAVRLTAMGGLGLVLGAALGATVKTETWRPLVRPNFRGGSSMGVGLSFSF